MRSSAMPFQPRTASGRCSRTAGGGVSSLRSVSGTADLVCAAVKAKSKRAAYMAGGPSPRGRLVEKALSKALPSFVEQIPFRDQGRSAAECIATGAEGGNVGDGRDVRGSLIQGGCLCSFKHSRERDPLP